MGDVWKALRINAHSRVACLELAPRESSEMCFSLERTFTIPRVRGMVMKILVGTAVYNVGLTCYIDGTMGFMVQVNDVTERKFAVTR